MTDVNLFAIFALVNGIVSVTFGLVVIAKNWRDQMNRTFFLMTIALAVWAFAYWQWQLSSDYDSALMWVRLLSIGSLFIPTLFYHWVTILIGAQNRINRIVLWLGYAATVAILFVANSNLFVAGLESKGGFQFWPNAGVAYDIYFSFLYVGLVAYAVYLLARTYWATDDANKKGQILYVLLGCLLGFGGGLTNFPLWWGIDIRPFGNILVAAFPFLLGYSVIKYRLFNVRAIIAELLVFSLMVFMFIIVLLADNWTLRLVYGVFFILMTAVGVILIKSSYALENANAGKTNLIHIMNHQIKGRLGNAKSIFAELLTDDYGAIPEAAKVLARKGLEETDTGISYIQNILNGMSAETGTLPYDIRPINFRDIVTEVCLKQRDRSERKGLSFETDFAAGDYQMVGDATQLKEAVRNLIDNAINYTAQGNVSVALTRDGNAILFAVKDSGAGIPEEDRSKLFTAGGRGKDSARINVNSTGYGLVFVKGVVEAHKGRIWFESEGVPGKGTTFFVELPTKG